MKLPAIDNGFVIDIAPPLVLSIVPPFIVKVPVPSAATAFIFNVPAVSVIPPVEVLVPVSVKLLDELFKVKATVPVVFEKIPAYEVVFEAPFTVKTLAPATAVVTAAVD